MKADPCGAGISDILMCMSGLAQVDGREKNKNSCLFPSKHGRFKYRPLFLRITAMLICTTAAFLKIRNFSIGAAAKTRKDVSQKTWLFFIV